MKFLSKFFFLTLMGSVAICANDLQDKKVKKQTMSQRISSSHTKINQWKKKLTKQQLSSLKPLFEMYSDAYKEYTLNPHNADKQSLVLNGTKAIEHVMDNWDSFYKQHIAAQTFDKSVQDWKKMNSKQAVSKQVQMYEKAYEVYDKKPTDNLARKKLLVQQQAMKSLMV